MIPRYRTLRTIAHRFDGGTSYELTRLVQLTDPDRDGELYRLRVRIVRDSYVGQCVGEVSLWTPAGWTEVHSDRDEAYKLPSPYAKDEERKLAAADYLADELLAIALQII